MTATDELRRMLDERGVEHEDDEDVTRFFGPDGFEVVMQEDIDGKLDCLTPLYLTPEKAIEATLGETPTPPPPTPPKQPPYDELIESLRRDWDIEASWDGLRRFWYVGLTDEGVRKRDEREATPGRGTCRNKNRRFNTWECSECGATVLLMFDDFGEPSYCVDGVADVPRYCPNCGRRVVEQ